jgi:error-prone DNA polymerase
MFITIEDETGVSNLVIWPSLYERQRQIVLSARILGARARVQREGEVVHLVAENLEHLTPAQSRIDEFNAPFPLPHGRGDEVHHGGSSDARDKPTFRQPRDIYIPDLHLDTIWPATRDFR